MKSHRRVCAGLLCAALLMLQAGAVRADSPDTPWSEMTAQATFDAIDAYGLSLAARLGVATSPFFARAFPTVQGHGLVLKPTGAYRATPEIVIGLELPIVMVSVAQPAGSYSDVFTLGNPQLFAAHRHELWRRHPWRLSQRSALSLFAPLAGRGPEGSLANLRALQVANALDALRHTELYASGMLSMSLGFGLVLEQDLLGFELGVHIPAMVRVSRAELPADTETRSIATTPRLHAAARIDPLRWFGFSLSADLVFDRWGPVSPPRSSATTQFSLTPQLVFRLGSAVRLRADYALAMGGYLRGHAHGAGLSIGFEH